MGTLGIEGVQGGGGVSNMLRARVESVSLIVRNFALVMTARDSERERERGRARNKERERREEQKREGRGRRCTCVFHVCFYLTFMFVSINVPPPFFQHSFLNNSNQLSVSGALVLKPQEAIHRKLISMP